MRKQRGLLAAVFFVCMAVLAGFAEAAPEANGPPAARVPTETATPDAKETRRVAILPLIDRTGGWLTRQGAELLESRMEHELHIPLNETMHWVTFIDEDEALAAFRAALDAQGKKARPELAARDAAKALSADLVACLVVDTFYERMFMSWHGITCIESAAHVTLYGYDARHDRLIKAPGSRWEHTEFHPAYEVETLAAEALDEALRKAALRSSIFPLSDERGTREGQPA